MKYGSYGSLIHLLFMKYGSLLFHKTCSYIIFIPSFHYIYIYIYLFLFGKKTEPSNHELFVFVKFLNQDVVKTSNYKSMRKLAKRQPRSHLHSNKM